LRRAAQNRETIPVRSAPLIINSVSYCGRTALRFDDGNKSLEPDLVTRRAVERTCGTSDVILHQLLNTSFRIQEGHKS
jgi:hypothetical protein